MAIQGDTYFGPVNMSSTLLALFTKHLFILG